MTVSIEGRRGRQFFQKQRLTFSVGRLYKPDIDGVAADLRRALTRLSLNLWVWAG
jgi:hypothetical protein